MIQLKRYKHLQLHPRWQYYQIRGAGQVGGGQIYVQYTISYLDAYLKDIGQMFTKSDQKISYIHYNSYFNWHHVLQAGWYELLAI